MPELKDWHTLPIEEIEDCPYCNNVGWYTTMRSGFPDQEQCEFCYTVPTSRFNHEYKQAELKLTKRTIIL